jgi:hypothetical protein
LTVARSILSPVEARRDDNWLEVRRLQHQIEEIAAERNELLADTGANTMDPERNKRRHVRDKAVIDHLSDKVFEPRNTPDAEPHRPTTDTGLSVEKQVPKIWDPKKGGRATDLLSGNGPLSYPARGKSSLRSGQPTCDRTAEFSGGDN